MRNSSEHLPTWIWQLPEMPTDYRWFNPSAKWEGGHQMTFINGKAMRWPCQVTCRKYLGIDAFNECKGWIAIDLEIYEDSWDPIDAAKQMHEKTQPKCSAIALPSMLPIGSAHQMPLAWLLGQEFKLQKGHANDTLGLICRIIGQEAFQYKRILHPAPDKVHCSWAQISIQAVHRTLVLQSRIYMHIRKVMMNLGLPL